MTIQEIATKIEAAGMTAKIWNDARVYVKYQGKDIGYLTEEDDGSTGTCDHINKRAGTVKTALRA